MYDILTAGFQTQIVLCYSYKNYSLLFSILYLIKAVFVFK